LTDESVTMIGPDDLTDIARRLGLDDLDIRWKMSERPGGDERNIAHVHAEDDLGTFTIGYNFNDTDEAEQRTAVTHELLHVAFRHVGAVLKWTTDPTSRAWLLQALEEDTESLARALVRLWR
jgi:hypothetical protein